LVLENDAIPVKLCDDGLEILSDDGGEILNDDDDHHAI
jgi:hypothetical protein